MNQIQRVKVEFAQVSNSVLCDPKLSLKAKGMFAYFYSKPSTWNFSADRVALETKDARKSILAAMKELESAGYLQRKRLANGRVAYFLSFEPESLKRTLAQKPQSQNGTEAKRHGGKTALISNTQAQEVILSKSNTEPILAAPAATAGDEVNQILERFQMRLNPTINYGNKTQREAVKFLLGFMGKEKLLRTVDYAAQISGEEFAPSITTPYQLKEKLAQLTNYYQRKNSKSPLVASI